MGKIYQRESDQVINSTFKKGKERKNERYVWTLPEMFGIKTINQASHLSVKILPQTADTRILPFVPRMS